MERKHGTVSLKNWTLDTTDNLQEIFAGAVRDAAEEALQLALDDDETHAFMPAVFGDSDGCGGAQCDDPLTIYFNIALMNEPPGPIWASSLEEMLEDYISDCAEDGSWSDGLARIRDALRLLTDRINDTLLSNAESAED